MGIERFFGKKYVLESSEKFSEYLREMGVGTIGRKIGMAQSPKMQLYKEGDRYVIHSTSLVKDFSWKFKPGVEEEFETPDGRKVRSLFTIDGDVISEVQKLPDGRTTFIKRSFSDKELRIELRIDALLAIRIFKAENVA